MISLSAPHTQKNDSAFLYDEQQLARAVGQIQYYLIHILGDTSVEMIMGVTSSVIAEVVVNLSAPVPNCNGWSKKKKKSFLHFFVLSFYWIFQILTASLHIIHKNEHKDTLNKNSHPKQTNRQALQNDQSQKGECMVRDSNGQLKPEFTLHCDTYTNVPKIYLCGTVEKYFQEVRQWIKVSVEKCVKASKVSRICPIYGKDHESVSPKEEGPIFVIFACQ